MEELMKELNSIKKYIPYNTYRTIKGQMKSGNMAAARTGISCSFRCHTTQEMIFRDIVCTHGKDIPHLV